MQLQYLEQNERCYIELDIDTLHRFKMPQNQLLFVGIFCKVCNSFPVTNTSDFEPIPRYINV
jgi:hypothetical protein